MTFGFLVRLQELLQALLCLLRSFRFTWVRFYPLSSQVLYHYSVSMIVSRFTSFSKDFVVRSSLISKMFRSGHDRSSAFSARSPRYFRPQTDMATPVFREMSKNVLFTRYHFARDSKGNSWEETGSVSMFWNTFINQSFLELL